MTFTAEQRKKALDTRLRNAENRRLLKQNQATGIATTTVKVGESSTLTIVEEAPMQEAVNVIHDAVVARNAAVTSQALGWNDLPLSEAIDKLSNMKREYDRAASVVLSRQSRIPKVWTCWTQDHKQLAGRTAIAQCKGQIPDGKWVFIDNGAKDEEGNISPIVCCSQICFTVYQQRPRNIAALSRH